MSRTTLNKLIQLKQRMLAEKIPTPYKATMSPKFAEELNRELGPNGFDDFRKLHGHKIEGITLEISDTAPADNAYMQHKDEKE